MKVTGLRYVRSLNRQHNEFAVRDYMPKCLLDAVILRMKFSKKRAPGAQIASLSAREEREASTACYWAAFPAPLQAVRIAQVRLCGQRNEAQCKQVLWKLTQQRLPQPSWRLRA